MGPVDGARSGCDNSGCVTPQVCQEVIWGDYAVGHRVISRAMELARSQESSPAFRCATGRQFIIRINSGRENLLSLSHWSWRCGVGDRRGGAGGAGSGGAFAARWSSARLGAGRAGCTTAPRTPKPFSPRAATRRSRTILNLSHQNWRLRGGNRRNAAGRMGAECRWRVRGPHLRRPGSPAPSCRSCPVPGSFW